jgi:hypothetical protein
MSTGAAIRQEVYPPEPQPLTGRGDTNIYVISAQVTPEERHALWLALTTGPAEHRIHLESITRKLIPALPV